MRKLLLVASSALLLLNALQGTDVAGNPNRLLEKKLVLAHYMTKMVPSPEGEGHWASPDLYDPKGSTAALGGLYLTCLLYTF